jgi:hypothetical protein
VSIVARQKRVNEPYVTSPTVADAPAHAAARHEPEAPERAVCHREAPESHPGRSTEAPDAGEGRAYSSYPEHEFTHGRSQS